MQDQLVTILKCIRASSAALLLIGGFILVLVIGAAVLFRYSGTVPASTSTPAPSITSEAAQTVTPDQVTLPAVAEGKTYTAVAGDSLWKVATEQLGSGLRYQELAAANQLASSAWLTVGQELTLPSSEAISSVQAADSVVSANRDMISFGATEYTVQPGDTLWDIAVRHTDDPYKWVMIYQENKQVIGSNPDLIYPGTRLVVPAISEHSQPSQ